MRKEEITIYKFDELPEDTQQHILDHFRDDDQYPWVDENRESLKAFCDAMGLKHPDYEYGYRNYIADPEFSIIENETEVLEFTGLRLYKWVRNNLEWMTQKGKYRKTWDGYKFHPYVKNREVKHRDGTVKKYCSWYSRMVVESCCPYTGYCMDNTINCPLLKYIKDGPDKQTTLFSLMQACFWAWLNGCNDDYEYWMSEEAVKEDIEANEYEFTEDGELH